MKTTTTLRLDGDTVAAAKARWPGKLSAMFEAMLRKELNERHEETLPGLFFSKDAADGRCVHEPPCEKRPGSQFYTCKHCEKVIRW